MLDPALRQVGFGSYREVDGGVQMSAWLDVTRGRDEATSMTAFPSTWPADGSSVPLPLSDNCPAGGECASRDFPSFLESCPGYSRPAGLPLILQLGPGAMQPNVSRSSLATGSQFLEHCVFDETTFDHPDLRQRTLGRRLLSARHAVVVIPKSPLQAGARYTASVTVNGSIHMWTFNVLNAGASATSGGGDTDADGLPNAWEVQFGLNPSSSSGEHDAGGDADGDGRPNLTEYREGTHPKGFHTGYLAEGATSSFFDMSIAVANPTASVANVLLRFLSANGTTRTQYVSVPPLARRTVDPNDVPGLENAEFSMVIESDVAVVVDRTMTWDASGYGSHAETAIENPSRAWYLAEGATHSGFNLFYLVQNPNDRPALITVRYLLPAPASPMTKTYIVIAHSRFNIWVNAEALTDPALAPLAATDVSAVITADDPIIVERAMYLDSGGVFFGAGHESAGVTATATRWYFAEGATGPYFDLFLLFANPSDRNADVDVIYLLPTGETVTKNYGVTGNSRRTVWVDLEDPRLADTAVSAQVTSINGVGIVVERAMWWPGTAEYWSEAHNSPGVIPADREYLQLRGTGASNTALRERHHRTDLYPETEQ